MQDPAAEEESANVSREEAPSTESTEGDTSASSTPGSVAAEESLAESSQDATAQEGMSSCAIFYIQ